jgi:23S rRNA (adenine2030-N6)-methyltransferase
MNYRHVFHAGNFADVIKHAVLGRIIWHLRKKESAFRVIDTHAGAALYDLTGQEATRSGEWREGINRLLTTPLEPRVADLMAPYLAAIRAFNPGKLTCYPGSPALVREWLRPQDRLIACELEPTAVAALERNLRGDRRIKTIAIDGWTALSAYIPPKERRGLVMIDPPFEAPNEYARLAAALLAAQHKWPTGIYLAWYPIKDPREHAAFLRKLPALRDATRAEVTLAKPEASDRLRGCGLIIINPPWKLDAELEELLPTFARLLARPGAGKSRLERLGAA